MNWWVAGAIAAAIGVGYVVWQVITGGWIKDD